MLTKLKNLFASSLILFSGLAVAQEPLDGAYQKVLKEEKEIITYDFIREADVFWAKRIWRVIDIREKMNLPFAYPPQPLISIIHTAAKNGELTVYDPSVLAADEFKQVLPVDDAAKIGARTDTTLQLDPETLEEKEVIVNNELQWTDILLFRLKEDWIFNENTSTLICRIIGICPMYEYKTSDGTSAGFLPMYWVYYPDLRPLLARYEVYNPKNDAVRLSWEDLFEARMFQSTIYKESNVYDRSIVEYSTGLDQLLESDRIKQEMFEWEHDLWSY